MNKENFTIRKYRAEDKERLRMIAGETTQDLYKKSPERLETVTLLYNDYFTEYEPDNIFVAVNEDDQAVGYVICCTNFEQFYEKNKEIYIPKALALFKPAGWYYRFLLRQLKRFSQKNRVHLHIDLLPEAQRRGLGSRLLDSLSDHLYAQKIEYVSVIGIDRFAGNCKFYKKYGFKEFGKHLFFLNLRVQTKPKK